MMSETSLRWLGHYQELCTHAKLQHAASIQHAATLQSDSKASGARRGDLLSFARYPALWSVNLAKEEDTLEEKWSWERECLELHEGKMNGVRRASILVHVWAMWRKQPPLRQRGTPIVKNPRRTTVSAEVLRGVSVTQYMRATNHVLAPPARRHFTTSSGGFPTCVLTVTTSTAKTQNFTVFNLLYRMEWNTRFY